MKNTLLKNNFTLRRIFTALLALFILISLVTAFVGCGDDGNENSAVLEESSDSKDGGYTVCVVSDTGAIISDVTVLIYAEDTLADLIAVEKTDAEGKITFNPEKSGNYVAVLNEVPEGYAWEEMYYITSGVTTITLTTMLPTDTDRVYENGDLMYNFTVTDTDGKVHKLSELIKTYDAVVLNFWFTTCAPCAAEFPYLNEAYELYKDKIALIAIDPTGESEDTIKAYAKEKELSFPVAKGDEVWQGIMGNPSYPTTVVIDRHGRICFVHTGSITSTETFTDLFAYFTDEDYTQKVLNGLGDIPKNGDGESTGGNPTEVGGATEFEMTLEGGATEFVDVYKISHMTLTVESPNALIIYNGKEYKATDGVVSLYVIAEDTFTPIKLGVGNLGTEKETFKIVFTFPLGSSANPHPLNTVEFQTTVEEGNDQGVFYKYVAESSGTLTVECISFTEGVGYDYVLYNLDSYAQRTLSEDAKEGTYSVSIDVKKGQTVTVSIGTTPDSNGKYPKADFVSKVSFEEKDIEDSSNDDGTTEYIVTVQETSGAAVKGVQVRFEADDELASVTTDDNGKATIRFVAESCTAYVTLPEGYSATVTTIALTKDNPDTTLPVHKLSTEELTITVKDKSGKAVKDVIVTIGDTFKVTDSKGQVKFDLLVDHYTVLKYTAVISLPNGYKSNKTSYPFEQGLKKLDITVEKGENGSGGSSTQNINYTVTVKKADGTFVSGVAVSFEKDGVSASVKTTDTKGVATASLPKGSYVAKLAFGNGVTLNYDKTSTKLTESANSITVIVAGHVSNETTELYVGEAHHLSIGGNYCKLLPAEGTSTITYFIFVPERSGVYSFTTSYSNTKISYHGANTSFIFDQTASTDYKNNLFTLNVKEDNLGAAYIIGVEGGADAVVIVKRTGNAVLDIEDAPWTIYQPQKAPVAFTYTGSTFTPNFFNMCGSTADYNLVYNSADGYYHLGSKNGAVVYVMLGENAPYISFSKMLETAGIKKYFYDANGNFIKREDYTECMNAFVAKMDSKTGIYPLTDDLIYIIKQSGDGMGWWNKDSDTYLFADLTGVNAEILWMFALCTANS